VLAAAWCLALFGACGSEDAKKKRPGASYPGDAGHGGDEAGAMGPLAGQAGSAGNVELGGDANAGTSAEAGAATSPGGDTGAGGASAAGSGALPDAGSTAGGLGGAGGGPATRVFASVTALYDALDTQDLGEGDSWRVEWESDSRVTAGAISGTVNQGLPDPSVLDQGVLPLKVFKAADWTSLDTADSLSFDADGYPTVTLAANAAASASATARLSHARYSFRRFTLARLRIAQDTTTTTPFSGASFQLWDIDGKNRLIGNHFVEAGGGTQSVAIDYYRDGTVVLTGGSGTSAHSRVFEGLWSLTVANAVSPTLNVTMRLETLPGVSLGADNANIVGHGDWSLDQGFDYAPALSTYRSIGGTGTSSATGVALEVKRYVP
jgi:hypothetical protein